MSGGLRLGVEESCPVGSGKPLKALQQGSDRIISF